MKVKSVLRQHSLKTVKENTSIEIMRARERASLQTDRPQSRVSESAMTTLEGSTGKHSGGSLPELKQITKAV